MRIVRLLSVGFIVSAAALLMVAAHWDADAAHRFRRRPGSGRNQADWQAGHHQAASGTAVPCRYRPIILRRRRPSRSAAALLRPRAFGRQHNLVRLVPFAGGGIHRPELAVDRRGRQERGRGTLPPSSTPPTTTLQFWDGRAPSLEEQAKGPIANPVEMATTHDAVVARLQADPKYVALFKQAWGTGSHHHRPGREVHRLVRAHRALRQLGV